jgi:hypothetical protein
MLFDRIGAVPFVFHQFIGDAAPDRTAQPKGIGDAIEE